MTADRVPTTVVFCGPSITADEVRHTFADAFATDPGEALVTLPPAAQGDLLVAALWLHVFLAYPSGRPGGRAAVLVVAAGYLVAVGLQVAVLTLGGFGGSGLLTVVDRPQFAQSVQEVQLL